MPAQIIPEYEYKRKIYSFFWDSSNLTLFLPLNRYSSSTYLYHLTNNSCLYTLPEIISFICHWENPRFIYMRVYNDATEREILPLEYFHHF